MRFLILGATGMAGHMVSTYLLERGHKVSGSYRQEVPVLEILRGMGMDTVFLDAADPSQLPAVTRSEDFDVVVNCIGLLNRACDECPEQAVRINSLLPHRLESITAGTDCRVVHLSTDCVFAGNTGPYGESAEPDGTTLYDLTKASGELHNDKDLTLRQSIVGPDPDPKGIGLLNWFMAQNSTVSGYTCAMWTGLTTLELARIVEKAARLEETGLVQAVPDSWISKYDLLMLFRKYFERDEIRVDPLNEPRIDKRLIQSGGDLCSEIPSYEAQISDMADWVSLHRELYPSFYEGGRNEQEGL